MAAWDGPARTTGELFGITGPSSTELAHVRHDVAELKQAVASVAASQHQFESAVQSSIGSLTLAVDGLRARLGQQPPSAAPEALTSQVLSQPTVRLNVGGVMYTTTRSTLTKYPDSMIGAMFSGRYPLALSPDGSVFIDRDGKAFAHVLNYLRTEQWHLPPKPHVVERVRCEAVYFGLPWPAPALVLDSISCSATLVGHDAGVRALAVWRDRLVSSSINGSIRVWSKAGQCDHVLAGHTNSVRALALWRDGCLLSASADGTMRVWNDRYENIATHEVAPEEANVVSIAVWQGRVCYGCREIVTIRIWSEDFSASRTLHGHTAEVWAMTVWNGNLASGSQDGEIRVWSTDYECLKILKGHTKCMYSLTVWQGKLCSGSIDKTVRVWGDDFQCKRVLEGHSNTVLHLTVWHDLLVSSGKDGSIRFWDEYGECKRVIQDGDKTEVWCLAVWDNKLVSSSSDNTIKVWDGRFE